MLYHVVRIAKLPSGKTGKRNYVLQANIVLTLLAEPENPNQIDEYNACRQMLSDIGDHMVELSWADNLNGEWWVICPLTITSKQWRILNAIPFMGEF